MKKFILKKSDPIDVYFKKKDKTGWTCTSTPKEAMIFYSIKEAIEYNKKELYSEFEPIRTYFDGLKRYEVRAWVSDYGIFDLKKEKFIGKPIESLVYANEVYLKVFEGLTY